MGKGNWWKDVGAAERLRPRTRSLQVNTSELPLEMFFAGNAFFFFFLSFFFFFFFAEGGNLCSGPRRPEGKRVERRGLGPRE